MPPVRLTTVPGIDSAVFSFTTDIPLLDRWGTPLLLGPGSVTLAHTDDEYVPIANSTARSICTCRSRRICCRRRCTETVTCQGSGHEA